MSLILVTCLGMAGSLFEGAWVGHGLGLSPEGKWKDELRSAAGLAGGGTEQGHTRGCLSPTLILCSSAFPLTSSLTNCLGFSRSPSSLRCLLPSCSQWCPSHRLLCQCPDAVPKAKPCSGHRIGHAAAQRPACRWMSTSPAQCCHCHEHGPGRQGPGAGIGERGTRWMGTRRSLLDQSVGAVECEEPMVGLGLLRDPQAASSLLISAARFLRLASYSLCMAL